MYTKEYWSLVDKVDNYIKENSIDTTGKYVTLNDVKDILPPRCYNSLKRHTSDPGVFYLSHLARIIKRNPGVLLKSRNYLGVNVFIDLVDFMNKLEDEDLILDLPEELFTEFVHHVILKPITLS